MEHGHSYFSDLIILLGAAVVAVTAVRWLKSSTVIGYLIAGALIGPHALGLISTVHEVERIAEFGVIFLLFAIGLELSIERLKVMRTLVFGLGGAQVVVTGTIIALIAAAFGQSGPSAVVIGGALALSSTAFVLQLLIETGHQVSRAGRTAFAILLFQDLAVVPLLALIGVLADTSTSLAVSLAEAFARALVAVSLALLIGRLAMRPLFRLVAATRSPELFVATMLLVVLGASYALSMAGLSRELGAFLAGLLIAETEYRHQVEADIRPFKGLLLGLFFMSVGMVLDLQLVIDAWPYVLGLVAALIVGKAAIIALLAHLFRQPWAIALRAGLLLGQGGEFAFVLFGAALAAGLLERDLVQLLSAAVIVTMMLTPALASLGLRLERRFTPDDPAELSAITDAARKSAGHVLIAGFGRVGQTVARVLSAQGVPFIALDLDQRRVRRAREVGLPVFFGDASHHDVVHAAGADSAQVAVVTMDDPLAAERAVHNLHRAAPSLRIVARARDFRHGKVLERAGVAVCVPETVEASLQLGAAALAELGDPGRDVSDTLREVRSAISEGHEVMISRDS
ncbi:MAG: monovalent cation:proton antiporter-2 (CPA2) family protein [Geminicoccaceae bacterium]